MKIPKNLSFSEEHVWIAKKGKNRVRIGTTEYLLSKLDSIDEIRIEEGLEEGSEIEVGDLICEIISGKDSTEIISPISGKIVRINSELLQDPQIITESPYSDGWIFEIEVEKGNMSHFKLLTPAEYKKFIEEID